MKTKRLARRHRFLDQFQPLNLLQLALGLRRLGGNGPEPVGERLQIGDFLLLILVRRELLLVAFLPLAKKVGVIARVADELALRNFMHLRDDFIHELAVMGNEQHRARIILQVTLQPQQRKQIQMVRRFVQQQQVRFHHEQPCQPGAHDPAAAHFAGHAVEIGFLVAQPAQHLLRLGLDFGVVQLVVLGMDLHVLGAGHVAGLFEFVQAFFEDRQFLHLAGGHIEDGFVAQRFAFLRQMAHHRPLIAFNHAGIRLALLENDGEQRGFTRAVGADERYAFAIVHLERSVLEERPSAKGHLEITNDEHGNSSGCRRATELNFATSQPDTEFMGCGRSVNRQFEVSQAFTPTDRLPLWPNFSLAHPSQHHGIVATNGIKSALHH